MNEQMMNGFQPLTMDNPYNMQQELGSPVEGGMYNPDMQDPSMQALMGAYGQPEQPNMNGIATAQDMLGQSVPQLSEQDYLSLARQLGLVADDGQSVMLGGDPMVDPGYSDQYDIMSLFGGEY